MMLLSLLLRTRFFGFFLSCVFGLFIRCSFGGLSGCCLRSFFYFLLSFRVCLDSRLLGFYRFIVSGLLSFIEIFLVFIVLIRLL